MTFREAGRCATVRPVERTVVDAVAVVAGAVLVALAYLDALVTTIVVGEGAGPLTRRLTGVSWRAALRVHRAGTGSRHWRWALVRCSSPQLWSG